ncbi:MAG: ribosome maturation factor RimM [Defluviitaleaceae bacterium]|nr:ribosome maturation factor RimM [Defluviitaleaceae bacterium]
MDYFEIGKIVNTVGVKGEVRIYPTTDEARRYDLLEEIAVVFDDGSRKNWKIEKVRYHRNLVVLKLAGVDNVDDAHKLRGGTIIIERENAVPLGEDEYYIPDLIGMDVVAADGNELGVLTNVLLTGANDVYVVKQPTGKEILIPAIGKCILCVDVVGRKMTVELLEGLMS